MSIFDESDRMRQNLKTLKKEASIETIIEEKSTEPIVKTRKTIPMAMNRTIPAWKLKGCNTYEELERYVYDNPDNISASRILIWKNNLSRYKEIFSCHKEDQELKKINKRRCFACDTIKAKEEFKLLDNGNIDGYQCKECRKPKEK